MKNFILLVLSTLMIVSCAPKKVFVDTSCSGYKEANFERRDISKNGIGIMPVLGGANMEQTRRPLGEAVTNYFRQEFSRAKVKSPSEVIRILNANKLTDEYTSAISGYTISGIVPKELIEKLGKALDVDYLLYTRLLSDTEVSTLVLGNSTQVISASEIFILSQVWDVKLGDIVWEGKGGMSKLKSYSCDIVDRTAEGLSKVVGTEKNFGPCETKAELINSVKKSSIRTYQAIVGGTGVLLLFMLLLI